MERAYWIAWTHIKDIGPILIKRLHEQFGSLAAAWQATPAELLTVDGIGLVKADQINQLRSRLNPTQLLDHYDSKYPSFWTPADPDYPQLLWEIPDPPPVLYYRGPLRPNHLSALTLGIVGTRRPSSYGRRWTRSLSCRCAQQFTIISGMATGIDTYAHQSCLDSDGQTIAVLGTGVDVIYPRSNSHLYQRILETGLILSEYPDGTPPERNHFPQRNRIIAGLSNAVLVTEAPASSGALITAYLANDYGRHVYVLPASLDNPTSRGCLTLINTGATMVTGEEELVADLLNHRGIQTAAQPMVSKTQPEPQKQTAVSVPSVAPELQPIFNTIPDTPISLDRLVETTQLDTSTLLSGLLQLELSGVIVQLPGGQYRRT